MIESRFSIGDKVYTLKKVMYSYIMINNSYSTLYYIVEGRVNGIRCQQYINTKDKLISTESYSIGGKSHRNWKCDTIGELIKSNRVFENMADVKRVCDRDNSKYYKKFKLLPEKEKLKIIASLSTYSKATGINELIKILKEI